MRSAVQVFHDQGYAAATVADIVAGAGYTSGAFYWHFTNKADCFWHVIAYREQLRGDWSILAAELDPSTVSLEELLVRVFSHFAESLGGFTEWVLVMVDFHQQHRQHQEALARLAEIYGRWRDEVRRFVDALVVNGWIEAPADPALLAHQVFAFAEGLTVHGALYGRSENLAITERALIEGLVKLLRC
ncbi:MAG: TetR/AcrR family transcriptional regulator [Chloroflexota bacterium]